METRNLVFGQKISLLAWLSQYLSLSVFPLGSDTVQFLFR